jgi:hypothetical protein
VHIDGRHVMDPPRDLRPLEEPASGRLTLQPTPGPDAAPTENPPRFAWIPDIDAGARYALQLRRLDGDAPAELIATGLRLNFHTPDHVLPPGRYAWRYALWSDGGQAPTTQWSEERGFTLDDGLVRSPGMPRQQRYGHCNRQHPRLWLAPDKVSALGQRVKVGGDDLGWSHFFDTAVKPWIAHRALGRGTPGVHGHRFPGRTAPAWRGQRRASHLRERRQQRLGESAQCLAAGPSHRRPRRQQLGPSALAEPSCVGFGHGPAVVIGMTASESGSRTTGQPQAAHRIAIAVRFT